MFVLYEYSKTRFFDIKGITLFFFCVFYFISLCFFLFRVYGTLGMLWKSSLLAGTLKVQSFKLMETVADVTPLVAEPSTSDAAKNRFVVPGDRLLPISDQIRAAAGTYEMYGYVYASLAGTVCTYRVKEVLAFSALVIFVM